jgi:hypothetical protein
MGFAGIARSRRTADSLLVAGVLLASAGLVTGDIPWELWLTHGGSVAIGLLLALAAAAILARFSRIDAFWWLAGMGILLPALALSELGPLVAGLLVIGAGIAIGTRLPLPLWAKAPAGLAVLAGTAGWLLVLPIHRSWVWSLICLALIGWHRKGFVAELRAMGDGISAAVSASPWAARLCAVALLPAMLLAWMPLIGHDDLTYHLILGHELLNFGAARFDVGTQSWALAPWLGDVLQALAMVVSGRESSATLNIFWLLAGTSGAFAVGRFAGLSTSHAWLAAAAYASIPVVGQQMAHLQVEAVIPVFLAALVLSVARSDQPHGSHLLMIVLLAAALLALKISALALLGPIGLWLLVKWRFRLPWRAMPAALGVALLVAGSSYTQAWWLAGNPVLPLFNALFESPWFKPVNFRDLGWMAGMHWSLPWDLSFHTDRYANVKVGAAGMVLVTLAGGWVTALAEPRLRAPLLATLAGTLLLFSQMHFLRYVTPSLVVLVPLAVAGLYRLHAVANWRSAVMAGLIMIQASMLPLAYWPLIRGGFTEFVAGGRHAYLTKFAPVRLASQAFDSIAGPTDMLLHAESFASLHAELPGRSMGVSWHSPRTEAIVKHRTTDPQAWQELVDYTGATYILVRTATVMPGLTEFLQSVGVTLSSRIVSTETYALPRFTEQPQRVTQNADGVTATAFADASSDAFHLSMDMELSCSIPGSPLAVAWIADRGGGKQLAQYSWVSCGLDGTARTRAHLSTRAATLAQSTLSLRAKPARPEDGMTIGLISAGKEQRRNPFPEGELGVAVRERLCRMIPRCDPQPARLIVESLPRHGS